MHKLSYLEAIKRVGVLAALARFDPHVAGTPPLGLDVPNSDIDILCHAVDPHDFVAAIWTSFSSYEDFAVRQWRHNDQSIVATFRKEGWFFELFGHVLPVEKQQGWRHFLVERRLLAIGGEGFRAEIMRLRLNGMKTEPAFAAVLNLKGDPYQVLLDIDSLDDYQLRNLLKARLQ